MRLRPWSSLGIVLLLAACAPVMPRPGNQTRRSPAPAPTSTTPQTPTPTPTPLTSRVPLVPPFGSSSGNAPEPAFWPRLRQQFAMADCPEPAARRARFDVRNPTRFEEHIRKLLPIIVYIQHIAASMHVAGEFVMLPWVESHFRNIAPRRGHAAGMWQIMAITARGLDLPMNRHYDGRLDRIASTRVALGLIARYHAKWKDWRIADMAYNTGEYRMIDLLKAHGMPPPSPVIPALPVGSITRNHLTRLLAIACIIRDPDRFHVKLPLPEPGRQLEVVTMAGTTTVKHAAQLSGISARAFRWLNPGYLGGRIGPGMPSRVLLPGPAAKRLELAMAGGKAGHATNLAARTASAGHYTVAKGDSLWSIAHRFGLSVAQLRGLNQLHSLVLHPGQVLSLDPPQSADTASATAAGQPDSDASAQAVE